MPKSRRVHIDKFDPQPHERTTEFVATIKPWVVTGRVEILGPLRITEFNVSPALGYAPEITSATLRLIPVGELLDALRATIIEDQDPRVDAIMAALGRPVSTSKRALDRHMRQLAESHALGSGGRKRLPDGHYLKVAKVRLELEEEMKGRGVNQALADRFGVSVVLMRDWLHRARELGYLAPGRRGQRGALPGPRLTEHTTEKEETDG